MSTNQRIQELEAETVVPCKADGICCKNRGDELCKSCMGCCNPVAECPYLKKQEVSIG
jgi:hypothetical protein